MNNHIQDVAFWLVFERRKGKGYGPPSCGVRSVVKKPSLARTEIAMRVKAKVDMRLFDQPEIEAVLVLDESHVQKPVIEIDPVPPE